MSWGSEYEANEPREEGMTINIVNVSGGVDSTACYLLALERGEPFRAVFADTGNEHEITIDYIHNLPRLTGGPEIQTVKADFSQRIGTRRLRLEMMRDGQIPMGEGWTPEAIDRVLEHLHPTGIPFLDLVLWKGRFPSTKARFCTQFLKMEAIRNQATGPAIAEAIAAGGSARDAVNWVGIRRDESAARANAAEWSTEDNGSQIYRPLVEWSKDQCFDLLKRHGVEPNPLYKMGCGRVGCMPCLMARKSEIMEIAKRWPHHIDRIREWERLAGLCSKRGNTTFFPPDTTPGEGDARSHIDAVVDWAMTARGGKQYTMDAFLEPLSCSSLYGLCE